MRKTDKGRLKEKRGSGVFEEYKTWLKVHEFANDGRSRKVKGVINDRVYHLMSDLEYYFFINIQFNEDVIDIKEQVPLLPIEETIDICERLKVKHPSMNTKVNNNIYENQNKIMSTDLIVSFKINGEVVNKAFNVKYYDHSQKKRNIEKFQIEKEYWARKDIELILVTEKDFDINYMKVLSTIYTSNFWLKRNNNKYNYLKYKNILSQLLSLKFNNLNELVNEAEQTYGISRSFMFGFTEFLICKGVIIIKEKYPTKLYFSNYEVIKCLV